MRWKRWNMNSRSQQATSNSTQKRRVRRRKTEEHASHVIRVRSWEFYFSRHAADQKSRWEPWPIGELATLTFTGDIVRPEKSKYKTGKLTFSARLHQPENPQRGVKPVPIGSATARGE